ncbi:MAG TPA: hypothetical protein VK762_37135 [Polyangiaceae bacterium]|jgi:hypothetical protein|nr:hypothetical protein [Polyangiaceae bacterium]
MSKIAAASLFAGLPIVAMACIATVSEEDRPCPCASGWTCCASAQVCVAPGAECPTGDGGTAVSHEPADATAPLPDAASNVADAGAVADAAGAAAQLTDASISDDDTSDSDVEPNDGAIFHDGNDHDPIFPGDGETCGWSPQIILATKITLQVAWPGTALLAKASGTMNLWLLFRYAVDGSGAIAGTVQTCGMQAPATPLAATGQIAEGLSGPGQLQTTIPAGSWDGTPTTPITGAQGGLSLGSTFAIDPVVTLYGLKPTSTLASAAQTWPPGVSGLLATDLTYADGGAYQTGEGEPGIFALPLSAPPDALPITSLDPSSPKADEIWLVLRTGLSLYGTIQSCTEQSGTVEVDKLDSHVVACHLVDAGTCEESQYTFLDANQVNYSPLAASGTFDAKPMAASAGCADVLAALP